MKQRLRASKKIIFVPAFKPGLGGGHLSRCMKLTGELRAMGREAHLFVPEEAAGLDSLFCLTNFNPSWRITDADLPHIGDIEFIVLDCFQTPPDELSRWKKMAPVIGIDEGGNCWDSYDFLIDILPGINKKNANISGPSLLPLPAKRKKNGAAEEMPDQAPTNTKILITFGHEDRAGLGIAIAKALSEKNDGRMEITLLKGALEPSTLASGATKEKEKMTNIRILESIPNLASRLNEYDIVITHYGNTAFEALYSGTSVLLANPTVYHKKLAKAAGFIMIDSKSLHRCARSFNSLHRQKSLVGHCKKLAEKHGLDRERTNLSELLNSLSLQVNRHCPVCKEETGRSSISRLKDRTYYRCNKCGIIYMSRAGAPVEYEREYFFEFYKRQYGKTYIEDFPNLTKMAKRRLS
ncbi:MAG: hypothetical protein LBI12_06830, partial [Treponema sp.]|nr:hypothetical protein [Treponema sp.]